MNKQAMAVMTNITESQGEGGEQLENAFAAVAILTCEVWCGRGGGGRAAIGMEEESRVHTHKCTCARPQIHTREGERTQV